MLTERKVLRYIRELNESASKDWRDDRHMTLLKYADDGEEIKLTISMGKYDTTYYHISINQDGYDYIYDGEGDNVADMESIIANVLWDEYQRGDSEVSYYVSTQQDLGEELANIRYEADLTMQELSDRTGISANAICSIEKGQAQPKVSTLNSLLKQMGYRLAIVKDYKHTN